MEEPIVLEVTRLDSPSALQVLLETAGRLGDVFGLVTEPDRRVSETRNLLKELNQYLVERSEVLEWPGNSTEDPVLLSRFTVTEESLRILYGALPDVLLEAEQWDMPCDLHFVRSDGSPVLVSISCVDAVWFELRTDELESVSDPVRQLLGLRPPPPLATVHFSPAWGNRADSVVDAPVDDGAAEFEELACREVRPGIFEVCCIPFHLEDLALGDMIRATSEGQRWVLTSKLSASGRFVADVFVSPIRISPQEIAVTLEAGGYLIEWADDRRIAANVEDQDDFERLIGILIPDIAPPGLSVGAR